MTRPVTQLEFQSLCATSLYLMTVSSRWTCPLMLRKKHGLGGPNPQKGLLGFFFNFFIFIYHPGTAGQI